MNIFKNKLIVVLMIMIMFHPLSIEQINGVPMVLDALKLVVCYFVAIAFFRDCYREGKFSLTLFNIVFILLHSGYIASTVLSNNSISYCITQIIMSLSIMLFMILLIRYNSDSGIGELNFVFTAYAIINTLSVLIFPDGMYQNNRGFWLCWFLGEDNGAVIYYIVAVVFSLLYASYVKRRITLGAVSVCVSFGVFVFMRWIGTGIVCLCIMAVLLLISYRKKIALHFKMIHFILANVVIFVTIILLRLQEYLAFIIEDILKRDMTFTTRTFIWDNTLTAIKANPLFGYGIISGDIFADRVSRRIGITNAHNLYLQFTYWGGYFALALFVVLLIMASKQFDKNRKYIYSDILVIGIFVILLRGQFEGNGNNFLFVLLPFTYYIKAVESKYHMIYKQNYAVN